MRVSTKAMPVVLTSDFSNIIIFIDLMASYILSIPIDYCEYGLHRNQQHAQKAITTMVFCLTHVVRLSEEMQLTYRFI